MTKRTKHAKCPMCQHVERIRFELELAGGSSIKAVARKYKLPYHPLQRHWKHVDTDRKVRLKLGPVQQQALVARISEENSSVIDSLKIIRAGLYEALDKAQTAGDLYAISLLAGKLHENLRITGNITGELASSPLVTTTNNTLILESPFMADLRAMLVERLRPFPEAARAVIEGLEALSQRTTREAAQAVTQRSLPSPERVIDAE